MSHWKQVFGVEENFCYAFGFATQLTLSPVLISICQNDEDNKCFVRRLFPVFAFHFE
jgi:hypothetical protein